jgi:peroxiredoxin-like protein
MSRQHVFEGTLQWGGGRGTDEQGRLKLDRSLVMQFLGKPPIDGSSPGVFNGNDARHNPETLMVASLMSCHLLTYLAVCERAGIELLAYDDGATGMLALKDGKMRMVEVVLRPQVRVAEAARVDEARELHAKAHANCFMSNSVNFEVRVEPAVTA